MFRRARREISPNHPSVFDAMRSLHAWALSLPWVVERPYSVMTPGVRTFGVECEPLDRRQLWLVTGLHDASSIAVFLPTESAREMEAAGLVREIALMPRAHVLTALTCDPRAELRRTEQLLLTAYGSAMAA
jgi:hypothetical protein